MHCQGLCTCTCVGGPDHFDHVQLTTYQPSQSYHCSIFVHMSLSLLPCGCIAHLKQFAKGIGELTELLKSGPSTPSHRHQSPATPTAPEHNGPAPARDLTSPSPELPPPAEFASDFVPPMAGTVPYNPPPPPPPDALHAPEGYRERNLSDPQRPPLAPKPKRASQDELSMTEPTAGGGYFPPSPKHLRDRSGATPSSSPRRQYSSDQSSYTSSPKHSSRSPSGSPQVS